MKSEKALYNKFFTIIMVVLTINFWISTSFAFEWSKTFGGSGNDYGNSVQQTTDGGYIIIGSALIKTDADGNELWNKGIGGNDGQQTTDGGFIITGIKSGDVSLIKTDGNGNKLWEKTFGGSGTDDGRSVQQTADGGFIIVGYTEPFDSDDEGGDVYLIKTDGNGNKLWEKTFGGSGLDFGSSVQQTADGGFIIAGDTDYYGVGGLDVYLIKTDGNGNKLWEKTFGGYGSDIGRSVRQIADDGFIIAGETNSFGVGESDVYLIYYNPEGSYSSEIIGSWSGGIWHWDVAASEWTKMFAGMPPGDITAGDFTDDGNADVAFIWSSGLWYQDGATPDWTKLSNIAPAQLTAGDITGN